MRNHGNIICLSLVILAIKILIKVMSKQKIFNDFRKILAFMKIDFVYYLNVKLVVIEVCLTFLLYIKLMVYIFFPCKFQILV